MSKKSPPPSQLPYEEPEWLLPFQSMEIGDSFFIPTMKPAYFCYVIDTAAKKSGVKIKVFVTSKDDMLGVRAWRTG
jgi:hypothetical protein